MYNKINNADFVDMSDKDKFIYLMKNNWKEVSQYVELAWNKRTDIMYKNT